MKTELALQFVVTHLLVQPKRTKFRCPLWPKIEDVGDSALMAAFPISGLKGNLTAVGTFQKESTFPVRRIEDLGKFPYLLTVMRAKLVDAGPTPRLQGSRLEISDDLRTQTARA